MHQAMHRMSQRGIDQALITALIETGTVKASDGEHWWIFKDIPGRDDNLVCAAVILLLAPTLQRGSKCGRSSVSSASG